MQEGKQNCHLTTRHWWWSEKRLWDELVCGHLMPMRSFLSLEKCNYVQSNASFSLFAWFDMIIVSSDTWCAFLRIYCRCNLLHCGSYERYIHKYTYICSRRSFMKEAVHINAIFHLFFWPSDLMQSSLHRTVQRVLSTFILHHFIKLMFLNVLQFVMNWLFILKYDQNIVLLC